MFSVVKCFTAAAPLWHQHCSHVFKYAEGILGNKQLLYECSWMHKMCVGWPQIQMRNYPIINFSFQSCFHYFDANHNQNWSDHLIVFKSSVYILKVIFNISCLGREQFLRGLLWKLFCHTLFLLVGLKDSSPKTENYVTIYSPLCHSKLVWHSSVENNRRY